MLKQRVLTALVLAPLFIAAIYLLPLPGFALLFAAVVVLAATEWATLGGLSRTAKWVFAVVVGLCLAGLWIVRSLAPDTSSVLVEGWLYAALVAWVIAIYMVLSFQPERHSERSIKPGVLLLGVVLLPAAWLALLLLRQMNLDSNVGSHLILLLFVLVWLADAGAYFAGKAFGQRKLAPRVSPGKTIEGAVGGLLAALAGVSIALVLLGAWSNLSIIVFTLLIFGLVVVSVFGDLFESVLKRSAGVKDSGQLLPGHGGVLDRIDSLLAVLPPFALLMQAPSTALMN